VGADFIFSENSSILVWLDQINRDKIPHAQIVSSRNGGLAWAGALSYVRTLLCDTNGMPGGCGSCDSCKQTSLGTHPDVHYIFPVSGGDGDSASTKTSEFYFPEFRIFLKTNPFPVFKNWVQAIGAQKKILQIGVKEASYILGRLSLKSHAGKHKVLLIWLPEKLNTAAANKLLKTIEEPHNKTLILFISHDVSSVLPTIVSRCQSLLLEPWGEACVEKWLRKRNVAPDTANILSQISNGDPGIALDYLENRDSLKLLAEAFVHSLKISFKKDFIGLNSWVEELSGWSRDQLKDYFLFSASLISQLAQHKTQAKKHILLDWFPEIPFKTDGFTNLLSYSSLPVILLILNESSKDVSRNINSKILLFDTGIKLMNAF